MNGINYLVDTNCFIYLLDENPIMLPFLEDTWAFSYVTEIELLCKKGISSHEELVIKDMLNSCFKINHTQKLTDTVISLKRKYHIKLPDAIIAASAQLLQIPLITVDKGFAKISDIDCILLDF
ncbi:PIN domain-containing protein [Mucilaginibacter psychrotolerans]|uniref:PIN domain-containing protein n=1 Tax=Mucilaginibacter psychrotolerans TaxID=1524096 RepID=A0A4Y8S6E4_9SPHI|nr:PIN domain-containing protein [Mucilaginibacter psychrotolerans]TFF34316.1 PIN domain-containing protein [Mucilaginibacter psychrotolerans]